MMLKEKGLVILLSFLLVFTVSCEQKHKIDQPTITQKSEPQLPATTPKKTPAPKEGLPVEVLKKGDKGEAVTTVQKALKQIGYDITVDGVFGQETEQSILDLKAQVKGLEKNAIYDEATRLAMTSILSHKLKITPGVAKTTDAKPGKATKGNGTPDVVVSNPTSTLVLVNKYHRLPDGYRPPDLVEPNVPFPFKEKLEKRLLRKVAAVALEKMFADASSSGLHLYAQSGFRSYERQKAIFTANTKRYGSAEKANQVSAYPGESEHQTGLTMDVTCPKVNFALIEPFATTAEGRWLKVHAHEYGFIIRYPENKTKITGYTYEPWHIRYVGVKVATDIFNRGITLEEYLGQK